MCLEPIDDEHPASQEKCRNCNENAWIAHEQCLNRWHARASSFRSPCPTCREDMKSPEDVAQIKSMVQQLINSTIAIRDAQALLITHMSVVRNAREERQRLAEQEDAELGQAMQRVTDMQTEHMGALQRELQRRMEKYGLTLEEAQRQLDNDAAFIQGERHDAFMRILAQLRAEHERQRRSWRCRISRYFCTMF